MFDIIMNSHFNIPMVDCTVWIKQGFDDMIGITSWELDDIVDRIESTLPNLEQWFNTMNDSEA